MQFQSTREQIVRTCRQLADNGYLAGTGGNVALRADESHLAVTPSATDYYTMSAADVCVVRLSDGQPVEGDRKPSVETGLHVRVLRNRPECQTSIHTHQPVASAFTLLASDLPVLAAEHRSLLGSTVPCAGYAPSGTSWLAGKVARLMCDGVHACLMRNHGVVCVGTDVDQAIARVAVLEKACALWFEQQLTEQESKHSPVLIRLVRNFLAMNPEAQMPGPASKAMQ